MKWYNPDGRSIVNGGAMICFDPQTCSADVLVVRMLRNGMVGAFTAKLTEDSFYNGVSERLVGESADDIFSGWDEQHLAELFWLGAYRLPFNSFKEIKNLNNESAADLTDCVATDTMIRNAVQKIETV